MTVAGQIICQSIHWLKCNNHVLHSKTIIVTIHRFSEISQLTTVDKGGGTQIRAGGAQPPGPP